MNHFKSSIIALLASAIVSTSALAINRDTAIAPTSPPKPIKVVQPANLPRHFTHQTIELALTIDKQGRPEKIEILSRVDRDVALSLVTALEQWRFNPAQKDGKPVIQRVIMPLELTADS